jgi:hypothetical protein
VFYTIAFRKLVFTAGLSAIYTFAQHICIRNVTPATNFLFIAFKLRWIYQLKSFA